MTVTVEKTGATMLSTVRDYGDQALLLELNSTAEVLAWTDTLHEAGIPGVLDIVPASRTVLVKLASPRYLAPTRQRLARLRLDWFTEQTTGPAQPDVVLDVVYDGEDLEEVAQHTGLTTSEVIAAHTATPWKVGFGGFAPGFAYLVGGDLFVKRFDYEPEAEYPDGGCSVELFTNDAIMEVETLSPMALLEPGGSLTHIERWYLFDNVAVDETEKSIEKEVFARVSTTE